MQTQLSSEQELTKELGVVYARFNKELFGDALTAVPFVIDPRRQGILRFEPVRFNIVVGANFKNTSFRDILDSLLHEMCHIFNWIKKISDQTSNDYHNQRFRETALRVGLTCIHSRNGWKKTTSSKGVEGGRGEVATPIPEFRVKREQLYRQLSIDINKAAIEGGKQNLNHKQPGKNYLMKYVCGCNPPHNSVRSGRRPDGPNRLNIVCLNCLQPFYCEEES
jgi:hypothetical protein